MALNYDREHLRAGIRGLCDRFPPSYWRELDGTTSYPSEFVDALTRDGWLSVLIPEEYGGSGLGISDAAVMLQEINRSGGNSAAAHAQLYVVAMLARHGNEMQKSQYLPRIASGQLRLQAFAVTEADAGSDTTRTQTRAKRQGDSYITSGHKVFISRAEHSDLMLLLARTTPFDQVKDKRVGLSLFLVNLREAIAEGTVDVRPIEVMVNHSTTELYIDNLVIPAENLIGEEGSGFRYLVDSWNAERILIAAECIGDGDWFVQRASHYASNRRVFGRPIGANQGVQFPIAEAYAYVRAAELMTYRAGELFDGASDCGAEANTAKFLASKASWMAANACLDAHGGYGFAVEYDIERKFRETRLYSVAPVNNNLVLAYLGHHVLQMPRSY